MTGPIGDFIGNGVQIFAMASPGNITNIYDFDLDQWIGQGPYGNLQAICKALANSDFANGTDNLGFDLTLQGGLKANNTIKTDPDSYYLSIVTEQTTQGWLTPHHFPDPLMNPVLAATAAYQGVVVNFDVPPIPGWGDPKLNLHIDQWRENDGAVSSISQRYPFTGGNHPVGGQGIFNRPLIRRGEWYHEKAEDITGRSFDHVDVGIGCFTDHTIIAAHKNLYGKVYSLLSNLP